MNAETLRNADIIIIATDHSQYDYEFIVKNSSHVIDTRNATKNIRDAELLKKIVLLGSGRQHTQV